MRRMFVAFLLAGAMLVARSAAVGAGPERVEGVERVIQPGQTLWSISRDAYPGEDPRDGVRRIRLANRLEGGLIRAGTTIFVPSR